jgi:hypothetical protein
MTERASCQDGLMHVKAASTKLVLYSLKEEVLMRKRLLSL